MEIVRTDASGRSVNHEGPGRDGGGPFVGRRRRDWIRGLLSNMGTQNDYLVFQPAACFTRMLGDRVLRLNDVLGEVRSQGPELIASVGIARLRAHYAGLDELVEATRGRLLVLTAYCNKGAAGRFREALESVEFTTADRSDEAAAEGRPGSPDGHVAAAAAGTAGRDVFGALRQRQFSQGILTAFGRDQGCVAFQPSPFLGRFLSELVYSLNHALRRLEDATLSHVMSGDGKTLQDYYLGLEDGLAGIGKDLDGIIAYCKREVA